jgi:hypothetical protein
MMLGELETQSLAYVQVRTPRTERTGDRTTSLLRLPAA